MPSNEMIRRLKSGMRTHRGRNRIAMGAAAGGGLANTEPAALFSHTIATQGAIIIQPLAPIALVSVVTGIARTIILFPDISREAGFYPDE